MIKEISTPLIGKEPILSNIFLKRKVAKNFEKSTFIPKESFYKMADFLIDKLYLYSGYRYRILDVGSGTGRTILNILTRLHRRGIVFEAYCFDISKEMAKIFIKNLNKKEYKGIRNSVIFKRLDAEDPDIFLKLNCDSKFDIVFIISVLHYLKDWKRFLERLSSNINGYLIQAELLGWYRLLDGSFDVVMDDKLSFEFWERYFIERRKYSPWEPEIKFSNLKPVKKFLENLGFEFIVDVDILWESFITWRDVLNWIKLGVVSSLGSSLNDNDKVELFNTMKQFLKKQRVNLYKRFKISWGFNLFVHCNL
jgi:SAM-dependent methyltransferase